MGRHAQLVRLVGSWGTAGLHCDHFFDKHRESDIEQQTTARRATAITSDSLTLAL